jgi:hypothetical protein
MPGIARRTDVITTNHLCTLNTTCLGASVDTFVGDLGVHCITHLATEHTYCTDEGGSCGSSDGDDCSPHTPTLGIASPNVLVNDKGVGRIGDTYVTPPSAEEGCGYISGWADEGTPTVFVN